MQRRAEHDAGVAEREPEADAESGLALSDEFACRVVDDRDVIGVKGVPHAEQEAVTPSPTP